VINRHSEVFLNAVAQGKASFDEAVAWFWRLPAETQQKANTWLCQAALQAQVAQEDVRLAIQNSGIRPTVSAATALSTGTLQVQIGKLLHMKGKDARHAFRLLLALFAIADERRRRTICKNGCDHWWHNLDPEWERAKTELSRQLH